MVYIAFRINFFFHRFSRWYLLPSWDCAISLTFRVIISFLSSYVGTRFYIIFFFFLIVSLFRYGPFPICLPSVNFIVCARYPGIKKYHFTIYIKFFCCLLFECSIFFLLLVFLNHQDDYGFDEMRIYPVFKLSSMIQWFYFILFFFVSPILFITLLNWWKLFVFVIRYAYERRM